MWDKRKEISWLTDKSQLILVIGIIFFFNTDQLPLIYNWLKWLLLYQNSGRMTHNVIWITQQGLCVTICYWIWFVMIVIKSTQYTGGDFMFLYRFVRRHLKSPRYTGGDFMFLYRPLAPPAADSCSRDNFWTIFRISFMFGTIVGPDL